MTNLHFNDIFKIFIIGLFFFVVPFYLTAKNFLNLFRSKNSEHLTIDIVIIFLGFIYSLLLAFISFNFSSLKNADYNDAIYPHELHNPLHSDYGNTIVWIIFIAYIGLLILCIFNPEKLSPLISALSIAVMIPGFIAGAFIYVQLAAHFQPIHLMLYLYYVNLILIAVRRIKFHITEHIRLINERQTVFRYRIAFKLYKIMSKVSTMTAFSFLLIFPVAAVLEIIFILCGQGPDGFIKAFTMTADWTFSTQAPPPPIDYEGHYLCTVAAGGHKKIVRPLRYGKRLNKKIIVNRQLLAANAFEDLIKEKLPRFHAKLRRFYDNYGYPISRHITTRFRADIVYIFMKPLEHLFIFILYLCDTAPENRIAVQYSDYKKEI